MSLIDFLNMHIEKNAGVNKYVEDKCLDVKEVNSKEIRVYSNASPPTMLYELPTTSPVIDPNDENNSRNILVRKNDNKLEWALETAQTSSEFGKTVNTYTTGVDVLFNVNAYFNLLTAGWFNYLSSGLVFTDSNTKIQVNTPGVYNVSFSCCFQEEIGSPGVTNKALVFGIMSNFNDTITTLQESWLETPLNVVQNYVGYLNLSASVMKVNTSQSLILAPYVRSLASPNIFKISNFAFTIQRAFP